MGEIMCLGEEKEFIEQKRHEPYSIVTDIIRQGQSERSLVNGSADELLLVPLFREATQAMDEVCAFVHKKLSQA